MFNNGGQEKTIHLKTFTFAYMSGSQYFSAPYFFVEEGAAPPVHPANLTFSCLPLISCMQKGNYKNVIFAGE